MIFILALLLILIIIFIFIDCINKSNYITGGGKRKKKKRRRKRSKKKGKKKGKSSSGSTFLPPAQPLPLIDSINNTTYKEIQTKINKFNRLSKFLENDNDFKKIYYENKLKFDEITFNNIDQKKYILDKILADFLEQENKWSKKMDEYLNFSSFLLFNNYDSIIYIIKKTKDNLLFVDSQLDMNTGIKKEIDVWKITLDSNHCVRISPSFYVPIHISQTFSFLKKGECLVLKDYNSNKTGDIIEFKQELLNFPTTTITIASINNITYADIPFLFHDKMHIKKRIFIRRLEGGDIIAVLIAYINNNKYFLGHQNVNNTSYRYNNYTQSPVLSMLDIYQFGLIPTNIYETDSMFKCKDEIEEKQNILSIINDMPFLDDNEYLVLNDFTIEGKTYNAGEVIPNNIQPIDSVNIYKNPEINFDTIDIKDYFNKLLKLSGMDDKFKEIDDIKNNIYEWALPLLKNDNSLDILKNTIDLLHDHEHILLNAVEQVLHFNLKEHLDKNIDFDKLELYNNLKANKEHINKYIHFYLLDNQQYINNIILKINEADADNEKIAVRIDINSDIYITNKYKNKAYYILHRKPEEEYDKMSHIITIDYFLPKKLLLDGDKIPNLAEYNKFDRVSYGVTAQGKECIYYIKNILFDDYDIINQAGDFNNSEYDIFDKESKKANKLAVFNKDNDIYIVDKDKFNTNPGTIKLYYMIPFNNWDESYYPPKKCIDPTNYITDEDKLINKNDFHLINDPSIYDPELNILKIKVNDVIKEYNINNIEEEMMVKGIRYRIGMGIEEMGKEGIGEMGGDY